MVKNKTVLYDIIGVDKTASLTEIKKAYRIRALELHPDKNAGKSDSKAGFQELQKAYEILRDETRRKEYDRTGKEQWCEPDQIGFVGAGLRRLMMDCIAGGYFEPCAPPRILCPDPVQIPVRGSPMWFPHQFSLLQEISTRGMMS
eukprot:GHVU01129130.1.p2 GENE.GHVU01129130.1~~GHVU01129130.1.p2  ORF type:complete len:145 (-),score=20.16 GHVU01129130.1:1794-2228(-)